MTKSKNNTAPAGESFSLIPNHKLLALYAAMAKSRAIAEQARAQLPRQRAPKSVDSILGHEAAVAGAAFDLRKQDTLVHTLWPDTALKAINSTVANAPTISAAIKSALAEKNNQRVTLLFSSGKASAQPAWRKALAVAAENRLPILFLSLDRSPDADPTVNLAGIPVMSVDGNDVVAIYRVTTESTTYARKGRGPTLIDCRLSIPGDPIENIKRYLALKGLKPEAIR